MEKKTEKVTIRLSPESKEHLYKTAKKYTNRNSLSEAIIVGLDLFEIVGEIAEENTNSSLEVAKLDIKKTMPELYELAKKYANGSIDVLLYKIKEQFSIE